jgi:hypothetical protein
VVLADDQSALSFDSHTEYPACPDIYGQPGEPYSRVSFFIVTTTIRFCALLAFLFYLSIITNKLEKSRAAPASITFLW